MDNNGWYSKDDEQLEAIISLGYYQNGIFIEQYRYTMFFQEGFHNYLIRCSTDYYWYLNQVNAVKIETDGHLYNVEMQILDGD